MASSPELRVQVRVIPFIGPGKMMLLEGIERLGSISAAARALDMSYARAWRLIQAMNQRFRSPLVHKAPGGHGGGGAALTETGMAVLALYRSMEEKARTALEGDLEAMAQLLLLDQAWQEKKPKRTE